MRKKQREKQHWMEVERGRGRDLAVVAIKQLQIMIQMVGQQIFLRPLKYESQERDKHRKMKAKRGSRILSYKHCPCPLSSPIPSPLLPHLAHPGQGSGVLL